ncbi:MAG: tRNA-uridine aminocarboxypropyltransferase [Undibacterium sp.]|uniref:tRNA-uridine aminocarboxypropyltransferase n=1 Tax=Undibacterium sp. TaxID=1914977 RepID=UPI002720BD19|nr:tRNA-uridine aminocarboxypropyltransferase [Undibacterium sp.]MDO8650986.1 tRNA-uridine aminocarboxypropyltransferase [Undibacterium sp.]
MRLDEPVKRQVCRRCQRPQSSCICHWIVEIAPVVDVVILQHPLEVHQAKGSARLLHLSLPGSQLHIGEVFAPALLQGLLQAPGKMSVLLYPETPAGQGAMLTSSQVEPALLAQPDQYRLIILDGTWRKSRKMLYQNPLLQTLPRLALSAMPASHYRIRKAHKTDQLSTLEASCYALMQLEQESEKYLPLLTAFDGFIGQQLMLAAAGQNGSGQAV